MEDGSHLHELLEALEAGVLFLERDEGADPAAAIHRIFQSAHNLKSGLAMAGLARASKLFHGLEDGLDDIRRGRLAWSTAWADAILDTVDKVQVCLEDGSDEDLDLRFEAPTRTEGSPSAVTLTDEESEAGVRAAASGQRLFRIEKLFLPGLDRSDFEGHLIYDDIRDHGALISVRPRWDEYSLARGEVVVRFLFTSGKTAQELSEVFFDPLIELPLPEARAAAVPRFRILVVDDDELTSEIIRRALAVHSDTVLTKDGKAGIAAFGRALDRGQPFDVVILDLEMPGADGHAVLQALRDDEESRGILGLDRCLIFMNTSSRDLEKVRNSFKLQADRFFIKPVSVENIKKRLEVSVPWLENRRRGVS